MLYGVCLGTNDLAAAENFYDKVLSTIGMQRGFKNNVEVGYAPPGQTPNFWILTPYNKQAASFGNGTQVIFSAETIDQVQAFHQTALSLGGTDEGAPGPRDYRPGYYGAYLRDLDGNKLHIYCIQPSS